MIIDYACGAYLCETHNDFAMNALNNFFPERGAVIRIHCDGYDHLGLIDYVDGFAEPVVLSISGRPPGHQFCSPLSTIVERHRYSIDGYLGSLDPGIIIQRAWMMQDRPYNLLTWNCEHFVYFAHGFQPMSPQKRKIGFVTGVMAFACTAFSLTSGGNVG